MIVRHYEAILRIECDCCCNEEFIPMPDEFDGEVTDISIAMEQAENMGWKKLEDDVDYHFCPSCVIKVFKEAYGGNGDQQDQRSS